MKCLRVAFVIMVFMLSVSAAQAEECVEIPWGKSLTGIERLTFSHAVGDVRYYNVAERKTCGISGFGEADLVYGFKQGKLYVALVEIDKAKDVKKVIASFMDRFGLPETKKAEGWDVYRWSDDKLKVKLKTQYSTDRIKIGMYYKPLAD